jgi:hypothetical protein
MPIAGKRVSFSDEVSTQELPPLDPELKSALYYSRAEIQSMKIHEDYMSQYRIQRAMAKRLMKVMERSHSNCGMNYGCAIMPFVEAKYLSRCCDVLVGLWDVPIATPKKHIGTEWSTPYQAH